MTRLILDLLKNCIEGGGDVANGFSLSFISLVFQFEQTFWSSIGVSNPVDMTKLFASVLAISLSLITMKFLHKLFATYIGGYEGDSTASPTQIVLNYTRALAVAAASTLLLGIFADMMTEVATDLLKAIHSNITQTELIRLMVEGFVGNLNLLQGLLRFIYFVCFLLLLIKFYIMGAEMFILRIFFPLACVGLVDSDKGIFVPVLKQMLNVGITAILQILLLRISMVIAGNEKYLPALAFIMLAMKTPQTMQFIMFTGGGGGGLIGRGVSMAYHLKSLIRSVAAK